MALSTKDERALKYALKHLGKAADAKRAPELDEIIWRIGEAEAAIQAMLDHHKERN